MTDRELLELAAKAAGINVRFGEHGYCYDFDHPRHEEWNPLTDDGDALRLAVKLDMCLSIGRLVDAQTYCDDDRCSDWSTEPASSDPLAATRRAIVRAAAAVEQARAAP